MAQLSMRSLSTTASASLGPSSGSSDYSLALYSFLDRLSPIMFMRLYESRSAVLSVFRLLPLTVRHLVLNLLWLSTPASGRDRRRESDSPMSVQNDAEEDEEEEEGRSEITLREMALWVRERKSDGGDKSERRHLNASLSALARLHILTPELLDQEDDGMLLGDEDGAGERGKITDSTIFVLNSRFRSSLRQALTGGGKPGSFGQIASSQDPNITIKFLDQHAELQWETIQHFMVSSSDPSRMKPSEKVLQLLNRSGLMHSETKSLRSMRITSKGFQFLLEDVNSQLWDLLLTYLESSEDLVETIGFLFMLGSLELGRGYVSEGMTPSQLGVLSDLADYGLVYRSSSDSPIFYPTRLATTLTSSAPPLLSTLHSTQSNESQGFLVLETNYKLYAYTSNPLQIAVLGLFASLKTRFANFVTGMITRESVRRGLENGITANQLISYLTTRAHPQMVALHEARRNKPNEDQNLLPTTVVDQIRLWEHERRRINDTPGYLYDSFSSSHDYGLVATYAKELRCVLLELPKSMKLVVTNEGHLQVREYIKRRMAVAQQEAQQQAQEGGQSGEA
ncbi:TFIIH/NER complex subunit TFB2 [Sporobolomyces salmoneus]|uniref:TFIIH/NER complex subunit TFB2 n=1 Tax=Sporobolomyces salmoneus TaxID=183962 RepID=UPI00316FF6E0